MSKYDKYIGELFDGVYKIEKIIGIGGMAVVFQAHDTVNDRTVAVKMLREEINEKRDYVQRFINESKTLSMLEHPNIVNVYLVNTKGTPKYMVMEKVEGINLQKYMSKKKPGFAMTLSVVKQTLDALEHANSKGITHRDIKPHNIMLKKDGTVVLTDFGIASFAGEENKDKENAIGTALYISPEQAQGKKTDCRSDIYSLGVVMYEMLTGKHPFTGESAEEIASKHINTPPEPPHVHVPTIPTGLEQIILRAMGKNPEDRFSTPLEMKKYLERVEEDPFAEFSFKKQSNMLTESSQNRAVEKYTTGSDTGKVFLPVKEDNFSITPSILGVFAAFAAVVLVTGIYILITLFPDSPLNVFNIQKVPDVEIQDYVYSVYTDRLYYELLEEGYDVSIEYYITNDYPENTIISQTPSAGRVMKKTNLKINLTVTVYSEKKQLKNYTMLDYRQAVIELENLGYKVQINKVKDSAIDVGVVISMYPEAGTLVEYGSNVVLTVSEGSSIEYIKVADYTGSSEIVVVADVYKYYRLKSVSYEYSDEIPAGHIISQSIPAGMYTPKGSFISFVVSLGKEAVTPEPEPTPIPTPVVPPVTDIPSEPDIPSIPE